MSKLNSDKLWVFALILIMAFMFFPAINGNIEFIKNHDLNYYDSLIYVPPFFSYLPENIKSDYTDEYILNALIPIGYKQLYIFIAKYFDPVEFSNYQGHLFLMFIIAVIGYSVREISGTLMALCAVMIGIAFSGNMLLWSSLEGGSPRSFGHIITALALLGLIKCRPHLLAAITIFSTFFYPQAGLVSGCCLALMLLLPPEYREPIANWSFKKRATYVIMVGLISAACLLPQALSGLEYGDVITKNTVQDFPEFAEGGAYHPGATLPYSFGITWALQYFASTFEPHGVKFIDLSTTGIETNLKALCVGLVFFFIAIGMQQIVSIENAKTVRLFLLLGSGVLLFSLAFLLQPYLYVPKRYFMLTIPIAMTALLPVALARLLTNIKFVREREKLSEKLAMIILVILVIIYGGKGYNDEPISFAKTEKTFLDNISTLDRSSMIAGFPTDYIMEQVRFYSKQKVFLSKSQHQVMHEDFTLNMRQRSADLFQAYYAIKPDEIALLSSKHNVSHILINKEHFTEIKPEYFEPFTWLINSLHKQQRDDAILKDTDRLKDAIVFQEGIYVLYDMKKLIEILGGQEKTISSGSS